MEQKLMFANTIADLSMPPMSECYRYGIMWGCDGNCPVFSRGECKIDDVDAVKNDILNTDRYDNYTFEELNKMYPQLKIE